MEFQHTLIYKEFNAIRALGDTGAKWSYSVVLTGDGIVIPIFAVQKVLINADFTSNFRDEIAIDLIITEGNYLFKLYPNRRKLKLSVIRTPITEDTSTVKYNRETLVDKFNAYLSDAGGIEDPAVVNGGGYWSTASEADIAGVRRIRLEVIDPAALAVQGWSVGINFRKNTLLQALHGLIDYFGAEATQTVGRKLLGSHIVPPKNTRVYNQIPIRQATPLIEAPDILHEQIGVYSAGFTHYLQGRYWYVFPLYDVNRFSETKRTITVYNIPPDKLPHIERTFRKLGNALSVLSTGLVVNNDDTEFSQINKGNGVRYADASLIMDSQVILNNGKATIDPSKTVNEFISESRADGFQQVKTSTRFTANQFYQMSQIASRMVQVYRVVWENSDPSLLYPGMPCRIIQMRDNQQETYEGVLAGARHELVADDIIQPTQTHQCNTEMIFYINKTPT